jgi:cytochrome c554/c'-like protein
VTVPNKNRPAIPVAVLAGLTIGTGLWAWFSASWSWGYLANLFFHPAVGLVWAVAAMFALTFGPGARLRVRGIRAGWLVAAASLAGTGLVAIAGSKWSTEVLIIASAVTGAIAWLAVPAGKGTRLGKPLAFLFAISSFTGIAILATGLGRDAKWAFQFHSWSSFALIALAVIWVAYHVIRARGQKQNMIRKPIAVGFFCVAALTLIAVVDANLRGESFRLDLSTIPMEKRIDEERIRPLGLERPGLLDQTDSCGKTADCHKGIVEDYARSTHSNSMKTDYLQKNMDYMTAEIGEENKNLCAGCHHPQSLFDDSLSYKDFTDRPNLSCVFCHVISEVAFPEDRRRSKIWLHPNWRHLDLLFPGTAEDSPKWAKLAVNLYPDGHGRALTLPLYKEDDYCQACHRLQIKPTKDFGMVRSRCVDCHMQPRDRIGFKGKEANHRFPGTNTATPYALGDYEQVEFTKAFAAADHPLLLKAWGQVTDMDPDTSIKKWLEMHYEPAAPPEPGKPFNFVLWTANIGVDHAFPAAPLDLIEVWLELNLTDSEGRTLMHSGRMDENHMIDPDARRLGGYMIGHDGMIVEKNRVWQISKKIIERQIAFGQRVKDEFQIELPEQTTGPLLLTARWNYRKLNQQFVDWAYGDGRTMPVSQIARVEFEIYLAGQSGVKPDPSAPSIPEPPPPAPPGSPLHQYQHQPEPIVQP